jgi:hypothetical protein
MRSPADGYLAATRAVDRKRPQLQAYGQFLGAGVRRASGWSRCCLSWWRDLTPSLRNALRRW